ncbi:MAG: AAA family ATPase [Desulfobacterium sp.]|jgi:general secretion pathway protein A|nr:AAA family ATPase [Desulfobacterium sp.]MDY0376267.1 AAA family ATPase [Desulfobacterium sp.]
MYRSFYNLKFKPFQISSDPAFLWLGEKHKEALATLRYGIMDNKGFLLLTGDVGTGKTTLINTLISSLGNDVICASVPDSNLEKIDFYNFVARGFGADREINSKGEFLEWFTQFLHTAHAADKKVLLIIDEAQLLTQEMLEEVRLLSNVELAQTKLVNIFFVGQNEFNETLSKPINRAVRQRLTLNYNIEPLGLVETAGYIEHRLHVAGTDEILFTPGAVREIYANSLGLPRRINVLCDHALLTGYVKDKRYIDQEIIRECARELDIPVPEVKPFPVPPVGIEQSSGKQPDTQAVQPPETPHEKHPWRRSPALAVFVLLGIFIFAGAFLFPDYARTVYVRGEHYITAICTEVRALLSAHFYRQPDQSATLGNSPDISLPGEQIPVKVETVIHGNPGDPFAHSAAESAAEPTVQSGLDRTTQTDAEPLVQHYLVPPLNETEPPLISTDSLKPVEAIDPDDEAKHHILPEKVVVRFSYNNNDFTEKALEDLSKFADDLVFHPNAKISIKGYTDSNGNQAYNQNLSQFRANIVKSFLLGKGADPDKIEALGMGVENPIAANDSVQGRMMNRRVEVEVISK